MQQTFKMIEGKKEGVLNVGFIPPTFNIVQQTFKMIEGKKDFSKEFSIFDAGYL